MAAGDEGALPRRSHNAEQNGEAGRGHSAPLQPVASGGKSFVGQVPGLSDFPKVLSYEHFFGFAKNNTLQPEIPASI